MYGEKVLDHYENPRNVGSLDKDDPSVGTGLVGAPACGDVMKLQLKISSDGIIEDAKFKTFGCGSAIAASSLATELVKGMTTDQAMALRNTQIVEELNLPPVKIHCSLLAEDAIKSAISNWREKQRTRQSYVSSQCSVSVDAGKNSEKTTEQDSKRDTSLVLNVENS